MVRKIVITVAITLTILSSVAFGAVKAGKFSVTPLIGGYLYDDKQDLDTSLILGIRGGYNITDAIGVEALYDYVTHTDASAGSLTNISLHRYGGQALYHFFPEQLLVPYLAAGYSGVILSGSGVSGNSHGAFDYGAGVKYYVKDDIAIRGEVRHILYRYDANSVTNLEYSLGVTFQFSRVIPTVTAVEPIVAPVLTPEPVKILASTVPEPIIVEAAPLPVPAPAPVTVVAAPASSLAVTTYFAPVAVVAKSTPVKSGRDYCGTPAPIIIEFGGSKTAVKTHDHKQLDRLGRFLKENPTAKGRIEGYTAHGTAAGMVKLSQARAESVQNYIVITFGIDGSRLSAIGYGQAHPIASNKTAAGRRKNYRVIAVFTCE